MTDDQKLIEEAAKAVNQATENIPWDNLPGWAKKDCYKIATAMRNFWAAQAAPEIDTAKALRVAVSTLEAAPAGFDFARPIRYLRQAVARLDREQRDNARAEQIGQAFCHSKFYGQHPSQWNHIELGRFAIEQVEGR